MENPEAILPSQMRSSKAIFLSTAAGIQFFPDVIQDACGEKQFTGFYQHGRVLGAIIPFEAVYLLAGRGEEIDSGIRNRIQEGAQKLLEEQKLGGFR